MSGDCVMEEVIPGVPHTAREGGREGGREGERGKVEARKEGEN